MVKYLKIGQVKVGGRNHKGKITVYNRGGGKKEKFAYINYNRMRSDIPFKLLKIETNIFGRKLIGLVGYTDGTLSFISITDKMIIGEWYMDNYNKGIIKHGTLCKLNLMALGSIISQIKERFEDSSKYLRSSGVFGQIISILEDGRIIVKMISGELRKFGKESYGVLGLIKESNFRKVLKAGDTRNRGFKGVVRGVAMNPIDHPHGGRTSRKGETPWGKKTKGPKTSNSKNIYIIKKRNE